MALDVTDIVVGLTGGVWKAVPATALPTDATTALIAGYLELGYITEGGVSQSMDEQTTTLKGWQNGDTVRTVQTGHDLVYSFAAMESNPNVLTAFYGNMTAGKIEVNGSSGTRGRWVIQVIDGAKQVRIVIPDGQLTDRGDVQYTNSAAAIFPMSITCYPDSAYAGALPLTPAKAYIYISPTPT